MSLSARIMLQWGIRLVLSACMLVGGVILLAVLRRMLVLRMGFSMRDSMYVAGFVTYIALVVAWILIWRGAVHWDRMTRMWAAISVPASVFVGVPLGILIAAGDEDAAWAFSVLTPMGLFLIGTTALWIGWKWATGLVAAVSLLLGLILAANWLRHGQWDAQLKGVISQSTERLSAQDMLLPGNAIPRWDWKMLGIEVRKETRVLWTEPSGPPQPNQVIGPHGWVRTGNGAPIIEVAIPYALLFPITLVAPFAWIIRFWSRVQAERRLHRGQCTTCGYDLRATPDRCPECGAVPEVAKGVAA